MNERFGLELGDADQLLFDQFEEAWAADEQLAARAQNNDFQNFRLVFDRTFLDTVVRRMDDNEEIFKRILDESEFRETVLEYYAEKLYGFALSMTNSASRARFRPSNHAECCRTSPAHRRTLVDAIRRALKGRYRGLLSGLESGASQGKVSEKSGLMSPYGSFRTLVSSEGDKSR